MLLFDEWEISANDNAGFITYIVINREASQNGN